MVSYVLNYTKFITFSFFFPWSWFLVLVLIFPQQENGKSKDGHLQSPPQNHIMNRQTIPNGSSSTNNDHGMVPQVNGNIYGSRELHTSYPPVQPGNSAYEVNIPTFY